LFNSQLKQIYHTTKSIPSFHSACFIPITTLTATNLSSASSLWQPENALAPPDSKLHLLPSLSDLELSLLIAAARLDIILDTDTCNFNMAYDEYSSLASHHKVQVSASGASATSGGVKLWGREVALTAWEGLAASELILPATGTGGIRAMDGGKAGKMWKVDVRLEEIPGSVDLNAVMAKWCREI